MTHSISPISCPLSSVCGSAPQLFKSISTIDSPSQSCSTKSQPTLARTVSFELFQVQGWRKQFYIGQAESLDTLECMENVATHIDIQATYIVQSTISMQGMLMLGIWEHAPQEIFEIQVL